MMQVTEFEARLRERRDSGHKLLVPYVTAGYPSDSWGQLIEGIAGAGADAIEVGIPFSDPVMDGETIQESSRLALEAGTTPLNVFGRVSQLDLDVPLIAMTYYNICFHMGHERFASQAKQAGIEAVILADLPYEEIHPWASVADMHELATVLLAAPNMDDQRLGQIVERSRGFVYGVGLMGVTGERTELAASALAAAKRLKELSDKPVLIGVGVSTPEQASAVCEVADGVIVGSAVIRQVLDHGIEAAIDFVGLLRQAMA